MRPWAPLSCAHRGTHQTFHATPKDDNEKIRFFKIQWNFVLTVIISKIYSQRIDYLTFLGDHAINHTSNIKIGILFQTK